MSLTGNEVDPELAGHYYQRCLRVLILELDGVQPDRFDDLLAATIILRLHEELDGPFASLDNYRHSMGTRALLRSQIAEGAVFTSVCRAAAWAGLRQEIYGSIKLHRPPAITASPEMLSHLRSSREDGAWADSAVAHCLEAVGFCFGDDRNDESMYDILLAANVRWEADRPASYDPLCFYTQEGSREGGGEDKGQYWNVRFHADWHGMSPTRTLLSTGPVTSQTKPKNVVATGWCYRSLARILLVIHNPRQPRVGLNRIPAWNKVLVSRTISNPPSRSLRRSQGVDEVARRQKSTTRSTSCVPLPGVEPTSQGLHSWRVWQSGLQAI